MTKAPGTPVRNTAGNQHYLSLSGYWPQCLAYIMLHMNIKQICEI